MEAILTLPLSHLKEVIPFGEMNNGRLLSVFFKRDTMSCLENNSHEGAGFFPW